MSFIRNGKTLLAWVLLVSTQHLYADAGHGAAGVNVNKDGLSPVMADSHAPIGVMGDHMHSKGEWMLSYRYMYMEMAGNRIGENSVTPETIATTVPNRFFGNPMQP
ncbi:MAG: hypothetical protein RLT30_04205, partial [Gammaproteobacteria bacterium]